jgi:hypothetical protein
MTELSAVHAQRLALQGVIEWTSHSLRSPLCACIVGVAWGVNTGKRNEHDEDQGNSST